MTFFIKSTQSFMKFSRYVFLRFRVVLKSVTLPQELLLVESTTTTTNNMKSKIPRYTKYKRSFTFFFSIQWRI